MREDLPASFAGRRMGRVSRGKRVRGQPLSHFSSGRSCSATILLDKSEFRRLVQCPSAPGTLVTRQVDAFAAPWANQSPYLAAPSVNRTWLLRVAHSLGCAREGRSTPTPSERALDRDHANRISRRRVSPGYRYVHSTRNPAVARSRRSRRTHLDPTARPTGMGERPGSR